MNLSPQNLQAIKSAIAADSVLNALPKTLDYAYQVKDAFNLTASPAFTVWKKNVTVTEIMKASTFDWTRVDNLSAGKARIWEWMTMKSTSAGTINPSEANVRTGIEATWSVAGDAATKAGIYTASKRFALRWEKLIAIGTGSDASPATMPDGFSDGEMLQPNDIVNAWAS